MALRRELGVAVDLMSPAALAALEPGLPAVAGGRAFFPDAAFFDRPRRDGGAAAAGGDAARGVSGGAGRTADPAV